jgi:serine/threonine protein kinase/Tfp pilus assembly protein PilF
MKPTSPSDDDSLSSQGTDSPTLDSNNSPAASNADSLATASYQMADSTSQEIAGRYKLLSTIGEGGMGSVWLAEQRVPVKRLVALKLIKAGMDSKAVIARFDAERQALAMMDHPNIAKILDGGIAGTGSPYFVMELVKGVPITEFCDSKKLNLKERLELFVPVCQAIQHAHQKGIIHRDIKPSNVLVASYDDKAIPKVIDFGVAKATGTALTDLTINTGFGVVGTPQYMSPEQATLNQLDIDTRSDIYSLGVLLYELLTGSPPFRVEELQKAGYMEMLRVIREDEPQRPSTKLSTADTLPKIAASRSTEPTRLAGLLRTELDWVVMKAIEKDRVRRYETANAFADDIERYLTGAPVQAHPPSQAYQFKKFIRRFRGPVIAASVVGLALTGGIAGTTIGLFEANWQKTVAQQERDKARESENEAISQKKKAEIAEEEALEAYRSATDDAISDLMSSKEYLGTQEKIYLQKTVERWNNFANRQGEDERSIAFRAEGLYRVGKLFKYLAGSPDEKLALAEQYAKQLCERFTNSDRYDKLLADILQEQRDLKQSLETQLSKLKPARSLLEKIVARNPNSLPPKLDLAKAQLGVADAYFWHGDYANAIEETNQGIVLLRKLVADEPGNKSYLYELSEAVGYESGLYYELRQFEQAFAKASEAFSLSSQLLQVDPEDRKFLVLQARNYQFIGDLDAIRNSRSPNAGAYLQSAIQIARDLCAKYPNDPDSLNLLAQFLNDYSNNSWNSDSAAAVEFAREAVAIQERLTARYPGTGSAAIATMRLNLLHKLLITKRYQECIDLAAVHTEFLQDHIKSSDDDFLYQQRLISVLTFQGQSQEALNLINDAEQSYREAFQASIDLSELTSELNVITQDVTESSAKLLSILKKQAKMVDVCDLYERLIAFNEEKNVRPLVFVYMQEYANFLVSSGNAEGGLKWTDQAIEGFQSMTSQPSMEKSLTSSIRSSRLIKARCLCLLGKHEFANLEWESVLAAADPKTIPTIRAQRVLVRFEAGLDREAMEEINELARSSSLPVSTWFEFARVYAQIAQKTPDQSGLFYKRSIALLDKAADGGFADYKAVDKDSSFAKVHDQSDFSKVLSKIEANTLIAGASKKIQVKDFAGCIADLDKALKLNPEKYRAFNDRGWAKHNLRDLGGALADYDIAIARDPQTRNAYNNKAFLLATADDPAVRDGTKALEIAEKGLQIQPSTYGLNAKSCALAALGKFDQAIELQSQAQQDNSWRQDSGIDGGGYAEARIESWKAKKLWYPPIQDQDEYPPIQDQDEEGSVQ